MEQFLLLLIACYASFKVGVNWEKKVFEEMIEITRYNGLRLLNDFKSRSIRRGLMDEAQAVSVLEEILKEQVSLVKPPHNNHSNTSSSNGG